MNFVPWRLLRPWNIDRISAARPGRPVVCSSLGTSRSGSAGAWSDSRDGRRWFVLCSVFAGEAVVLTARETPSPEPWLLCGASRAGLIVSRTSFLNCFARVIGTG